MNHACPVMGCVRSIKPTYIMCYQHWYMVSRSTRQRVLDSYSAFPSSPEHLRWVIQAIREANSNQITRHETV